MGGRNGIEWNVLLDEHAARCTRQQQVMHAFEHTDHTSLFIHAAVRVCVYLPYSLVVLWYRFIRMRTRMSLASRV